MTPSASRSSTSPARRRRKGPRAGSRRTPSTRRRTPRARTCRSRRPRESNEHDNQDTHHLASLEKPLHNGTQAENNELATLLRVQPAKAKGDTRPKLKYNHSLYLPDTSPFSNQEKIATDKAEGSVQGTDRTPADVATYDKATKDTVKETSSGSPSTSRGT